MHDEEFGLVHDHAYWVSDLKVYGDAEEGLVDAVSHGEGDALDGYGRTANDILFNPDGTLERVEREYERQANTETGEDGQTGLESQVTLAQIEQASEGVHENAETCEIFAGR